MKYKILSIIFLILLIPLAVTAAIALASGLVQGGEQNQASLLPSQPFTYQGELLDDGQPEPGPCDFQFGLWDAPTLGSQVGMTQTLNSVLLENGRFTVLLNNDSQIGASPFNGQALWMAIGVDCPSGTGSYVSLTPRQPLTAAPYAHFSTEASFVPWAGITSKPDGFADDIDDDTLYDAGTGLGLITTTFNVDDSYQLPQGCANGHLVEWNGTGWGCLAPEDPGYANVIVVAKSGGDYDSENRYLVWVAPGIYTGMVTMKSWVDIEGAGVDLTRIESAGSAGNIATVTALANSELRFLTVENTGGHNYAMAIRSFQDGISLRNIRAIASGANISNNGIRIFGGTLTNEIQQTLIIVDAETATQPSFGLAVIASSGDISVLMNEVTIEVNSSVNELLYGLYLVTNPGHTNIITATELLVNATNNGSVSTYGIGIKDIGTVLDIADSSIYSTGYPGHGFYVLSGSVVVARNLDVGASDVGISVLSTVNPADLRIDSSSIMGSDSAARVAGGIGNQLSIGSSLLDGNVTGSTGDFLTCVNSYDENYTNANGFDACP